MEQSEEEGEADPSKRRWWPEGRPVRALVLSGTAILVIWLLVALAAYVADRVINF
jgi:hypothetical protein